MRMKGTVDALRLFAVLAAMLFACLLLFSCGSGAEEDMPEYDADRRLTVESGEVSYTEEQITSAVALFAELGEELYGGAGISISRAELEGIFSNSVLPALYETGIYGRELEELTDSITSADPEEIYYSLLYTVGARRSGELIYRLYEQGKLEKLLPKQ